MTKPENESFKAAVRLHQSGDYRAALQSYLPLLDDPVVGPDVACNLSALSLQLGDAAAAERYARLSITHKPGHANGWNHLGLALRTRGAATEAGDAFRRAVSLDSRHAQAFSNLAEILADRDDIVGAIQCYERALAIDPTDHRARRLCASQAADRRPGGSRCGAGAVVARLAAARQSSPLFDGARFARDIEKAYRIMMDRHCSGEPPGAIDL